MSTEFTQIEGLEHQQISELPDDTPPNAVQTRFHIESDVMTFLSEQAGYTIRQNFIYVTRIWDLGRSSYSRRILDESLFDENTKKWKIKKLAPKGISDVLRNPEEWNSFMRGAKSDEIGTPLSLIFKNDPSRALYYQSKGITSCEQVSSLPDHTISELGMGAREDVLRAKGVLSKIKESAPGIALNNKLEEKDRQIMSLQAQIADLGEKLTEILHSQVDDLSEAPRKKAGRPKREKPIIEESSLEENLEG